MKLIFKRITGTHRFAFWQKDDGTIAVLPEWLISAGLLLPLLFFIVAGIDRGGYTWAVLALLFLSVSLWFDVRVKQEWSPQTTPVEDKTPTA